MKKYLYILMSAMLIVLSAGCSSDDDTLDSRDNYQPIQQELCKAWQLIGYGSESNFHKIDEAYQKKSDVYGYRFYLVFRSDGKVKGRESINEIIGNYTCNGDGIKFGQLFSTEIYDPKGNQESEEFLRRLLTSTSYGIKDGQKLRLYYSDTEFLYFEAMEKPWYIEQ